MSRPSFRRRAGMPGKRFLEMSVQAELNSPAPHMYPSVCVYTSISWMAVPIPPARKAKSFEPARADSQSSGQSFHLTSSRGCSTSSVHLPCSLCERRRQTRLLRRSLIRRARNPNNPFASRAVELRLAGYLMLGDEVAAIVTTRAQGLHDGTLAEQERDTAPQYSFPPAIPATRGTAVAW